MKTPRNARARLGLALLLPLIWCPGIGLRAQTAPVAVSWGRNNHGQTNVPAGLTGIRQIAAGYEHSLVLLGDGTVVAWGSDVGGFGEASAQGTVPAGLASVVELSAGYYHNLFRGTDDSVGGWGWNAYDQAAPPAGLGTSLSVSAGWGHSLALGMNGAVRAWGLNSEGQTTVPAGLGDVAAVVAGGYHSLVLHAGGHVTGWGGNLANMPQDLTNIVALAAGGEHSLALRADGTVVAWGSNPHGQTDVPPDLTDVVAIAACHRHSLALRADGTLVAWGLNDSGQTTVPPDLTNVIAVAAGGHHNLVLVGDGAPAITVQPRSRTGFTGHAVLLSSKAAGAGGLAYQWEQNGVPLPGATSPNLLLAGLQAAAAGSYRLVVSNALGVATSEAALLTVLDPEPPVITTGPQSQVVVAGSSATFRVEAAGSAPLFYQWQFGGLPIALATLLELNLQGVGPDAAGIYRVVVSNAFGSATSAAVSLTVTDPQPPAITTQPESRTVVTGSLVALAVVASGSEPLSFQWELEGLAIPGATFSNLVFPSIRAEDSGDYRVRISNPWGSVVSEAARLRVAEPAAPSILVAPTNRVALALAPTTLEVVASGTDPLLYQWRRNGQPLPGATNASLVLERTLPRHAGDYTVDVANGYGGVQTSPAVLSVTRVLSWGASGPPLLLVAPDLTHAVAVAAGNSGGPNPPRGMALLTGGRVVAWGDDLGPHGSYAGASQVPGDLEDVVAIAGSYYHNLVVTATGGVRGWGWNPYGQTAAPGALTSAVAVATGWGHSLCLTADGTVLAWGLNHSHQTDVPPGLNNIVAIAAGTAHSLALRADQQLFAWGTDESVNEPARVPAGLSNVIAVAAGHLHDLALREDGTVAVWGVHRPPPSGLSNVVALAAGREHSLLLLADGTVTAFGERTYVPAGIQDVVAVAAGAHENVVLLGDGSPAFTLHPGGQTVEIGSRARFWCRAVGDAPLTYQWSRDGTDIAGATGHALSIPAVQWSDAGSYRVIVSNARGSSTSRPVGLRVTESPRILTVSPLPQGRLAVAYSALLGAEAGTPPYRWAVVSNALPAGLTLDGNSGLISGTPTSIGTFNPVLRVTDQDGLMAERGFLLTVPSDLQATQLLEGGRYASPGTNTVRCEVGYALDRQLFSLFWRPTLPPGWVVLDATGDGSPEVQPGEVVFVGSLGFNPLSFAYRVVVPPGHTGPQSIGGSVEYLLDGMVNPAVSDVEPNPLEVPALYGYHDADYREPRWVMDGAEISRVLAYWRAQAYRIEPSGADGYAVGTGDTNGFPHRGDYREPAWRIDGTEVNRVLAYWRTNGYHVDLEGYDGYAPGFPGTRLQARRLAGSDGSAEARVIQTTSRVYAPGGRLWVTNHIEFEGSPLSLLFRPKLPAGWTPRSISGSGTPELVGGEVVWTGSVLPQSPVLLIYAIDIPPAEIALRTLSGELEYQFAGMKNPAVVIAEPGDLQVASLAFDSVERLAGSTVRLVVASHLQQPIHLQASHDLLTWFTLHIWPAAPGQLEWLDEPPQEAPRRFYRLSSP